MPVCRNAYTGVQHGNAQTAASFQESYLDKSISLNGTRERLCLPEQLDIRLFFDEWTADAFTKTQRDRTVQRGSFLSNRLRKSIRKLSVWVKLTSWDLQDLSDECFGAVRSMHQVTLHKCGPCCKCNIISRELGAHRPSCPPTIPSISTRLFLCSPPEYVWHTIHERYAWQCQLSAAGLRHLGLGTWHPHRGLGNWQSEITQEKSRHAGQ